LYVTYNNSKCKISGGVFSDTKFKQQKLPAWQPIMTVGSVLPVLFGIGVLFIPMGVVLLITSNNVSSLNHFCSIEMLKALTL
jgi:hypothetical protein